MNAWDSTYKTHQGNIGLGRAIAFYTSKAIPVMLPLNDSQKYDLVIDDGTLKRVSVKTTKFRDNRNQYIVQLKNTTLGSSSNTIRKFNNNECDILFVVTRDYTMYEIPAKEIKCTSALTLTESYNKYKILL